MRHIILAIAALVAGVFSAKALSPADLTPNDSVANIMKLKALHAKKAQLEKEIGLQDAKRNASTPGVAPETLEALNNRQDSVCLALRSELTDVILEIKEIAPAHDSAQLLQQYGRLMDKIDKREEGTSKEVDAVEMILPVGTVEETEE